MASLYPKSALTREPKITTQAQMLAVLKARSAPQARLVWLPPVKGTQRTENGSYAVLGCRDEKGIVTYYVHCLTYDKPKVIGHSHDPELARNQAEAHALEAK